MTGSPAGVTGLRLPSSGLGPAPARRAFQLLSANARESIHARPVRGEQQLVPSVPGLVGWLRSCGLAGRCLITAALVAPRPTRVCVPEEEAIGLLACVTIQTCPRNFVRFLH